MWFDFYGIGGKIKTSWLAPDSTNAWLTLDRDGNGTIDNGQGVIWQLFSPALNVETISLDFKESRKTDQPGNQFRYRARVDESKHSNVRRWAWDVFLVKAP